MESQNCDVDGEVLDRQIFVCLPKKKFASVADFTTDSGLTNCNSDFKVTSKLLHCLQKT